jgi:hypothetical protein
MFRSSTPRRALSLGALVSMACFLGSCASSLTIGNEKGGVIPIRPLWSEESLFKEAQEHCAKYGKSARITSLKGEAGGNALFDCL